MYFNVYHYYPLNLDKQSNFIKRSFKLHIRHMYIFFQDMEGFDNN